MTYSLLSHSSLTAFEPEARGHLVEGLDFHKYYFDFLPHKGDVKANVTISSPHVRLLGKMAAGISYVRLNQSVDGPTGSPVTSRVEETRVWEVIDRKWVSVHFHRSPTNLI